MPRRPALGAAGAVVARPPTCPPKPRRRWKPWRRRMPPCRDGRVPRTSRPDLPSTCPRPALDGIGVKSGRVGTTVRAGFCSTARPFGPWPCHLRYGELKPALGPRAGCCRRQQAGRPVSQGSPVLRSDRAKGWADRRAGPPGLRDRGMFVALSFQRVASLREAHPCCRWWAVPGGKAPPRLRGLKLKSFGQSSPRTFPPSMVNRPEGRILRKSPPL